MSTCAQDLKQASIDKPTVLSRHNATDLGNASFDAICSNARDLSLSPPAIICGNRAGSSIRKCNRRPSFEVQSQPLHAGATMAAPRAHKSDRCHIDRFTGGIAGRALLPWLTTPTSHAWES